MTEFLSLELIDENPELSRAAAATGNSRADFLRSTAIAGGMGAAALMAFADPANAADVGDTDILNFALTLEYLEAAFYTEAEAKAGLKGEALRLARVVGAHERAHVEALKGVLGRAAVKKPRFNFGAATRSQSAFLKTANVLEDTGVAAYKGQAPNIKAIAVLEAALAIHSVEARHASWVRHLRNVAPAPVAFDQPLSKEQVLSAVQGTGFIVGPATTTSTTPSFNG